MIADTTDIYDQAVNFLTANPDQIAEAWDDPINHPAGILFQVASPTGNYERAFDGIGNCGELCEIASLEAVAYTDEMTEIIREDERIPRIDGDAPVITVQALRAFAEWQRTFDLTWDRDPVKTWRGIGFENNALAIA